jgi:hypothetical protein
LPKRTSAKKSPRIGEAYRQLKPTAKQAVNKKGFQGPRVIHGLEDNTWL